MVSAREKGRWSPGCRGWVALLGVGVVLFAEPSRAEAAPEPRRLVVVLYPENTDGSPGTVAADRGLRSVFANDSPEYVEVRNEYVDISRARDPEIRRLQREFLRRKYAARKTDLVITFLASTLDYAREHAAEIFPGTPVVYAGVDQREIESRTFPPGFLGVPMRIDLAATLDLALRLHPRTQRVYVISGSAPFDTAWEAEARRLFRPFEERAEFVYLSGLPMDALLGRVAELPADSVIYYIHIFQDGDGKLFVPADALDLISRKANAPVYGHAESYVGRGIVGGRVISLETEGRVAARLGLRVLAGEKPEAIPIPEASENTNLFDSRELSRWGLGETTLPAGSVVRYAESTLWGRYRWHIIGGVTLCALEAVLIAGLLVQLVKRRRADERFRQVVETAPTGMLMVGRDGRIVMVNAQLEKLFGYGREEIIGQPVEVLVPEAARARHPADRDRYFTAPQVRPMGIGRELFGRRKDGSLFPVEIGLSPLRTSQGLFALASVLDLTERRRAEDSLLASRRELQSLTGRLLEAQEVERRRIARELHDDLNQSLALLSVEMDLLAGNMPDSPARAAERVRELSLRVKELSSAVHDLSHQLHPSKLEQLGLVPAIGGLCKELRNGHGLEASFTHEMVPGRIPAEVALCLYRIVQESLRNVVKHSGTRRATVDLRGVAGAIRLRVADDGNGFDPSRRGNGLGLVSMRERLNLLGGELVIDSRQAGGTRIDARIPLAAGEPNAEGGPGGSPPDHGVAGPRDPEARP